MALAAKTERKEQQAAGSGEDKEGIQWEEIPELVTSQLVQRREMLLEYFSMDITPDGSLRSIPLLLKGYTPSLAKLPRFLMRLGPCVEWNEEKACFGSFLRELAAFYTIEQLPAFDLGGRVAGEEEEGGGDEAGFISSGNGKETSPGNPEDQSAAAPDRGIVTDNDTEIKARTKEIQWALEHVLFPAFRARLVATKALLRGVVEVADLKGLYRVFERC